MHLDGLIVLLIIIGVVSSISKSGKKKKKAAEAQKKAEKSASAQPKAGATKIPYTREEWAQFLKEEGVPETRAQINSAAAKTQEAAKPTAAKPEDVARVATAILQKRKAQAAQPSVAAPVREAAGSIALDPTQGIEGETEAEHAAHRLRAEAAQALRDSAEETRQALAAMNLQTLRSAVVMKEILDKPVSLRPRGRR